MGVCGGGGGVVVWWWCVCGGLGGTYWAVCVRLVVVDVYVGVYGCMAQGCGGVVVIAVIRMFVFVRANVLVTCVGVRCGVRVLGRVWGGWWLRIVGVIDVCVCVMGCAEDFVYVDVWRGVRALYVYGLLCMCDGV